MSPDGCEARVEERETARHIPRCERLRSRYDAFWQGLRQGRFDHGHLERLRALIVEVRTEETTTCERRDPGEGSRSAASAGSWPAYCRVAA
ncbi:MAG: hypothetical protein NZ699_01045 [Roseiflexus sp.]|nr:hypothetical protein [Roseiflexus sp.]MDW8147896.1 hypothetical protein [Roseiflexaceae bacterium]MDW8231932.1 hypothetical protein [Roseiflexaceae bacterium]